MRKSLLQKIGVFLLLLALVGGPAASYTFGQVRPQTISFGGEADPDIFPFSSGDSPEAVSSPQPTGDKYTQDLVDVTDQGLVDAQGNVVQVLDPSAPAAVANPSTGKPSLPGGEISSSALEEYQQSIIANWGGKRAYTQQRLDDIRTNLAQETKKFEKTSKKIRSVEKMLIPIQRQIQNLGDQINLINGQITESKNKIKGVEMQIAEKQIALRNLYLELQKKQADLSAQRKIVLEYILMVYQEDERFRGTVGTGSDTLKLLLADSSVSENLLGEDYLSILEETGREVFYNLHSKKVALEEKRTEYGERQAELDGLNLQLNEERVVLEQNRQTQQELLEKTQGQEAAYQQLLEESLKQQLDSAITIENMKDNISFIEDKLKILDEALEQVKQETPTITDIQKAAEQAKGVVEDKPAIPDAQALSSGRPSFFDWPVPPIAITATFHDPSYPARWGIHQAIDLRAKQFTEIRAPANAYVFQTKDNGKGYSYIILAHKNKFVTVYGHVTEFRVKTGDTVKEGQVIGLSGGTPGTKGAGWQTTGPHLHFEVWHNGAQVDPLDWLPVMELPLEYIPDRFLKEMMPTLPSAK